MSEPKGRTAPASQRGASEEGWGGGRGPGGEREYRASGGST
jgi:hypothetical protein